MPTLNWIGKEAVVKHHKDVPFRLLEPVAELSCALVGASPAREQSPNREQGSLLQPEGSGNLIVQGDNLHALKALLPRYAGQVKCIYIDPPYNTGNEGWVYNDNVNSAEIKKWLGEVVGKEGETLDRHDRWLCMMYPRLLLLKQFLREDGAIFISIDDNEVATLRLLMDEIFGYSNFVANVLWQKRTSPDARLMLGDAHEHILVYARSANDLKFHKVPQSEKQRANFKNPDNDPRGSWASTDFSAQGFRPNQMYEITTPSGRKVLPPPENCWKNVESAFLALVADNRIWFGKDGNGVPRRKTFLSESDGVSAWTWWSNAEVGHSQEAKTELKEMLENADRTFDTPKPTRLIQRILQIATDKDSLVLDSFAGSGTTGHAVLKQNAEDGGNRRFILVEMDENIARNVTAERVRRVSEGYSKGQNPLTPTLSQGARELNSPLPLAGEGLGVRGKNWVDGLGGGFQFCTLSKEPLFTAEGQIREDVTYAQLAEFVWFVETGSGLNLNNSLNRHSRAGGNPDSQKISPRSGEQNQTAPLINPLDSRLRGNDGVGLSPLLGIHEGRAIYLLYNGILKDKSVGGGNVLTAPVLDILPPYDGVKVIYATACRLGATRLAREQIVFKQTPYALTV